MVRHHPHPLKGGWGGGGARHHVPVGWSKSSRADHPAGGDLPNADLASDGREGGMAGRTGPSDSAPLPTASSPVPRPNVGYDQVRRTMERRHPEAC
jgi:hypothetical protein